ncbi:preprotein translocase subunit YajC [Brevibacillus fulvus]|uniref:Preprotein translocase subunit YajC n=1 Tax=Brevibacillus fulvus TaxID=1125967 RepID=A0A938Y0W7_9BACL|nr:preprotein translocase subunit YajC [Brevibacillus fulvus]MBM7589986.1 preprotein translocase subunit YajC [Brevibacillus fulvus]
MQNLQSLLPIIIMFVIFYFLLIRPQQRRNKQRNQMLASLKKGDKVVTIGGVHGTIHDINDTEVVIRIAHNVNVTFDRGAINSVTAASQAAPAAPASKPAVAEPVNEETK